ncbi:hypothetical protein ACHAXS_006381, partial [Conticribra weissflogii]
AESESEAEAERERERQKLDRGEEHDNHHGTEAKDEDEDDDDDDDDYYDDDDDDDDEGSDINGVLFRIPLSELPDFDRREAGYRRVAIPHRHLRFPPEQHRGLDVLPTEPMYVYVPLPSHALLPDENHPLLQSYVDTVLQGCLEWGGLRMAERFVRTTGGWSPYFLNDTPSSRRPWMFRKQYDVIDGLLERHSGRTHYGERKHPEEFATAFHRGMRGLWGLPRRNAHFTGREAFLEEVSTRLEATTIAAATTTAPGRMTTHAPSPSPSPSRLDVVGMGGLGKTQLCVEYCHRHFPTRYGLVVWLNAESADSLVADCKQLLADAVVVDRSSSSSASSSSTSPSSSASDDNDRSTADDIAGRVQTALFQTRVPWLLVFDNLEDPRLLRRFLPRGAKTKGHVLVTTRHLDDDDDTVAGGESDRVLRLGCFDPSESLRLLARIAPDHVCRPDDAHAAKVLAEALGHLPLALGVAAAYMRRCDVSCEEYLDRYAVSTAATSTTAATTTRSGNANDRETYSHSVAKSLSLSVGEMEKENPTACEVLRSLSFLGSDSITKAVIRHLLGEARRADDLSERRRRKRAVDRRRSTIVTAAAAATMAACGIGVGVGVGGAFPSVESVMRRKDSNSRRAGDVVVVVVGTAVAASALLYASREMSWLSNTAADADDDDHPASAFAGTPHSFSSFEYEQADLVWDMLKSFSILTVKEGRGTIHRLMSQAMRYSQSDDDGRRNVAIGINAMRSMWTFKPERPDTWKESLPLLEHVKSVVAHSLEFDLSPSCILRAGELSREAGVFSAMALNAFVEAQASLELSLTLLDIGAAKRRKDPAFPKAKAETLHELGRVLRYQANYSESEQSLREALTLSRGWRNNHRHRNDPSVQKQIADTLHELGVLEVKKHNLDTAASFLQQSLDMRRSSSDQCASDATNADCAATLHQLAAIHVARKPPSLEKAKMLLQESLSLCRQIGQRAATLKQLARVSIRQGFLDKADSYLEHALELYLELYGDNKLHMNIAAVKFQQGALALQREQLEDAWHHFSECLRIRRHVYAYARPVGSETKDADPTHLEVSCVLHELGCVAFSQKRYSRSMDVLEAERDILEKLEESATAQSERLHQARLTNLTWLRKCAKELGRDDEANRFLNERTAMKKRSSATPTEEEQAVTFQSDSVTLQWKAMECRSLARALALEKHSGKNLMVERNKLTRSLDELLEEIGMAPQESMKRAAVLFRDTILSCIDKPMNERRMLILSACDELRLVCYWSQVLLSLVIAVEALTYCVPAHSLSRDVLRAHGLQVSDSINAKKKKKK